MIHPLKQLRAEKGWTQIDLAVESGLHPWTVNRIENGYRSYNRSTVVALAAALGIKRDDLARRLGEWSA